MTTVTVPLFATNGASVGNQCEWVLFDGKAFECEVVVLREESGFSAHCVKLPGATGEGATIEEALSNVSESLSDVIDLYLADGAIPWAENEIEGEVACRRRILINA